MSARFRLVHRYRFPASRVWAVATDYDALAHCCAPYLKLAGLPDGRCRSGEAFDFALSLFGCLPWQAAEMRILDCDDGAMRVSACMMGQGVAFWRHDFAVRAEGEGATLTDRVEIEAGGVTPFLALAARGLYRARHHRRSGLLRRGAGHDRHKWGGGSRYGRGRVR